MSKYVFLLDLDTVVTQQEILLAVAKELGMFEKMSSLTENTVRGEIPFKQSFMQKVALLKDIPISHMRRMIENVPLNEQVVKFINTYQSRCYVVTTNLDVWIDGLIQKIGMEKQIFCSKAHVENDCVQEIYSVVDKHAVIARTGFPCVAVGNNNHDAEMIEAAEIGIGYGGGGCVASSVLACASHVVYQETKLVEFLERLV